MAGAQASGSSGGSKSSGGFVAARSDVGLTPLDQSIAGATAKAATKVVLYPLDTWKSRYQASFNGALAGGRGPWSVKGVYRGLAPKLLLYTPYQAVYMGVYVQARELLLPALAPLPCGRALAFVASGVAAEVVASVVRLPMEVSKLRMQLGIYRSSAHAVKELALRPWSFYGNFVPQTLSHDCVYSACSWLVFESSRQWLFIRRGEAELQQSENLALGTLTGAVSSIVTTPLDVLKTRVVGQAPDPGGRPRLSLRTALRELLRNEGPGALWRGATLRVAHLAPSHGLYMFLYEASKRQIAAWRTPGG